MKTYRIIIANEAHNYTSTKYSNTLTGFTSEEAASKAAKQALRDAAGELMRWDAICYVETLNAWVLANNGNWLLVAKIEEVAKTEPTNNTPATMNANETTEFSELTHAGQCLDIYLHNTAEIYERYTVPAINAVVEAVKRNGWQLPKEEAINNLTFWTSWQDGTKKALQAAARLVKKHDHMTPTAKDIEQVTRNYAAYIVDCAKYEIEQ